MVTDSVSETYALFRTELTVPEEAIDENGHVNNVVYVQWMQNAAIEHSQYCGGTAETHRAGCTWVIRSHRIEYLKPAYLGDKIEITTWVSNIRRIITLRKYMFTRISDGELLARGETDWVFINSDNGRPSEIPEIVRTCYKAEEILT